MRLVPLLLATVLYFRMEVHSATILAVEDDGAAAAWAVGGPQPSVSEDVVVRLAVRGGGGPWMFAVGPIGVTVERRITAVSE